MNKISIILCAIFLILLSSSAFAVVGRMWGDDGSLPLEDSYFTYFTSGDNPVKKVIASSGTQNSMYVGAVSGAFNGTLVVNRVEKSTGAPMWSNDNSYFTFGGTNAQLEVMPFSTIPPANDVYVANPQRFFPSQTAKRLEVKRVSSNGTSVWTLPTDYPPNSQISLKKIGTDSAGNIFVPYQRFGTGPIWVKKISPAGNVLFDIQETGALPQPRRYDFIVHPTGSFFIIHEGFGSGNDDWLRGFDSSGTEIFSKNLYRYAEDEYPVGLSFSSDNGLFYLAQLNIPSPSYRLFKLDLIGNNFPGWPAGGILPTSKYVLPAQNGGAYSIFSDSSENAIELTNYNNSGSPIFSDKKIMKYSASGSNFFVDSSYNLYALLGGNQTNDLVTGKFNPDGSLFPRWISDTGINASGANYDGIKVLSSNDAYFSYDFDSDGYGGIFVISNGYVNNISSRVLGQRINELAPRIDSVTDLPDPSMVGQTVTFTVNWSDAENDPVRMYICRGLSDELCTGFATICKDDVLNTSNPKTCTYQTVAGDVGTNNYYAWLCGNVGNCSYLSSNFTVQTPLNDPPIVSIPECSEDNGTTYAPCNTITLNDSITNVKANCTDPENNIANVRFILTNPSSVQVFNALNSSVVGANYFLDNIDVQITPIGNWTLTATCTDSGSLSDTNSISWNVSAINQPPTANITSPTSGDDFTEGEQITFVGSAVDPEEGTLNGNSLQWTIEDGTNIGSGTSFNYSALSLGNHTITLTATDSQGLTGTATIQIEIIEAPIEKIVISNMQVEPFVVRNELGINVLTTIKNSSNASADVSLNLNTGFDCNFSGMPQTQTLQPRETYTFESMLNFATDCANPLTDT
ncbi:MAG: PKD domain-containing protein, partial [archaeon]|nr:PKD domain-containing protein [archaeon]